MFDGLQDFVVLAVAPAGDPSDPNQWDLGQLLTEKGVTTDTNGQLKASFKLAAGELLRLWAVHHIGVISRTRSDRLGPLVSTGPFALVRNPLYLGNIALWVGFAISAQLVWLAPIFIIVLGLRARAPAVPNDSGRSKPDYTGSRLSR